MLWALYTSLKDLDGNLSLNLGGSADRQDGWDGWDFMEFPIPRLSGKDSTHARQVSRDNHVMFAREINWSTTSLYSVVGFLYYKGSTVY